MLLHTMSTPFIVLTPAPPIPMVPPVVCVAQPQMFACAAPVSSCWMHRPPGGLMQLPPPPPGRPGQLIRWSNGTTAWLGPEIDSI